MSNPATLLTLLFAAGFFALCAPGASAETTAAAADTHCTANTGQCTQAKCEWFGEGCWNEQIFELVVSDKADRAPRRDAKLASTGDGRALPADRRPPAVWVSFHIGGF
jgi:hypothetical protein